MWETAPDRARQTNQNNDIRIYGHITTIKATLNMISNIAYFGMHSEHSINKNYLIFTQKF